MEFKEAQCDEIRTDIFELSQKYKAKNWEPSQWYPVIFMLLIEACYDAANKDQNIFTVLRELLDASEEQLTK